VLTLTRKGGKRSVEALAPATVRALETYLADRTSGPVFLNGTEADSANPPSGGSSGGSLAPLASPPRTLLYLQVRQRVRIWMARPCLSRRPLCARAR